MFTHSQRNLPRFPELLENLKNEFDTMLQEINMYKARSEEYERKLQSQHTEMTTIKQQIYEIERAFQTMKHQYEEEIVRLRRQLEGVAPLQQLSDSSSSINSNSSTNNNNSNNINNNTLSRMSSAFSMANFGTTITPTQTSTLAPTSNPLTPPTKTTSSFDQKKPSLSMDIDKPKVVKQPTLHFHPTQSTNQQKKQLVGYEDDIQSSNNGNNSSSSSSSSSSTGKKRGTTTTSSSTSSRITSSKSITMTTSKDRDWFIGVNKEVDVEKKLNIDLDIDLVHDSVVCCVKFSLDGKYIATGCNKKAQIFDVMTGSKLKEFIDDNDEFHENFSTRYIRSVVFSPNGRYLATGGENKKIKIWDISDGSLYRELEGHTLDIYSLDFSKDGKLLLSGSGDQKVKLWDVEQGICIKTLGEDDINDGVTSVQFSPDGCLVAAGSLDKEVSIWDIEKGYKIEKFKGHNDAVYSIAFSPNGKSLVSGSLDQKLKLWDLNSTNHTTFEGHKDYVLSVTFSPDGEWLVSGSKDRNVHFWDPRTTSLHMMLQGHKNSVIGVDWNESISGNRGKFATGSGDSKARIWSYHID